MHVQHQLNWKLFKKPNGVTPRKSVLTPVGKVLDHSNQGPYDDSIKLTVKKVSAAIP